MPTPGKTGSVRIRLVDGSERTLPIHGLSQLQMFGILDELGVKKWSELTDSSLQSMRVAMKNHHIPT